MTKQFYYLANCLLGLIVICGVSQSILIIRHPLIVSSDEFVTWFIIVVVISLTKAVLLIRYYNYKRFLAAFTLATISALVYAVFGFVIFKILEDHELVAYYQPLQIINVIVALLYGISLLVSVARKRFWLKLAGIYTLLIGVPTLIILIYVHQTNEQMPLYKLAQWLMIAGDLTPMLFILNFIAELKSQEDIKVSQESTDGLVALLGVPLVFIVLLAGVGLNSALYWGQQNFEVAKKFYNISEGRYYTNGKGDTLFYRLLKPLNYDPHKKYPLVIGLPYGGQPPTDKIRQIEGAAISEFLSDDKNRKKYPAFIFVPNCPAGSGWGGIPNYPSVDTLAYKAIESLDSVFSIDPKRRYIGGVSRGGYGTWHFICMRPDLFAAAIPICGGEDPKCASQIVDVAVWAFHGTKDKNVPVSGSPNMIRGMQQAGAHPKYTEYSNQGHNIWNSTCNTPGLWDWLFAQKKR